jgi:N-acetylmuramic acid 6-phosphate etherase
MVLTTSGEAAYTARVVTEPKALDDLLTEARAPTGADHDLRSTGELVELMNRQDAGVPAAMAAARAQIAAAIEEIVARLARGGRLIYVGAGSSGRLAALDAAECESTFSTEPGQVVALVAGGLLATPAEQAAAEDDAEAGASEAAALGVGEADAVVAVSASGRTPYVVAALRAAADAGALTVALVSVPDSELARIADHEIAVVVGPEFLAGSTRLKAGTAQKLVLNTISTVAMIRLGKTYGDLMVDVHATNEKLRERVRRIVRQATGASEDEADRALEEAQGSAKVAIVSLLAGIHAGAARARLDEAGGSIRDAVAR